MLLYVFRIHRQKKSGQADSLEDWIDFVRDAAHRVESIAAQMHMQGWVAGYRIKKWRFAGETARQQDGRWSCKVLDWKPNFGHGRSQGRPRTRWVDLIEKFAGGAWMNLAQDAEEWSSFEEAFANHDNLISD